MNENYKPQFLYTGSSKDLIDQEKYIKFGGTVDFVFNSSI